MFIRNNLKTLYSLLFLFGVWSLVYVLVPHFMFPNPLKTIFHFVSIFFPVLSKHIVASFFRILISLFISTLLGVFMGLITGFYKFFDHIITPILYLLYPIPKVAFLPVFMIIFGLNNASKIALITAIIVFQIAITTRDSIKQIEKEYIYSVKSLGMSNLQIHLHLNIPFCLPKIITSIRNSIGAAISILFFAENYATNVGLGYFIMDSWFVANYVNMFCGIIALSLLGYLFFKATDLIEKHLCKWLYLS